VLQSSNIEASWYEGNDFTSAQRKTGGGRGCLDKAWAPRAGIKVVQSRWKEIYGVAIPSTIFNNQFARNSQLGSNGNVMSEIAALNANSRVSNAYILTLPDQTRDEVISGYLAAVTVALEMSLAVCAPSFFMMRFGK
jgi:hypothetical protein